MALRSITDAVYTFYDGIHRSIITDCISRTGCGAIEAIMQGQRNVMIGVRNNEVVYVPLSEAIRSDKPFDRKLIKVLDELSI